MFKKVLTILVVLSVVVSRVSIGQATDGKLKIKFAGVDVSKLKVDKVERLTYDANKTEYKSYMYPKWSPDDKMIAFTSAPGFEGAEFEEKFKCLWVMNADGSNKRKLTDEEGIGYNFEWTPDSKSIVYKVGNRIKEIEVETKKSYVVISAKRSISPMIKQPSGEIITVIDEEVMGIDKSKTTGRLKASKSKTNNKKVVYSLNSQIWSADADGKNKVLLGEGKKAILSPDSKAICRVENENGSRVEHGIVIVEEGYKIWLGPFSYTPSWASDGTKILAAKVRVEEQTRNDYCIKSIRGGVMDSDLFVYNIYKVGDERWKKNLKNIKSDLFIYRSDKDRKYLTTTKDEAELSPDWSPDGSKILYVSGKDGDIYVITLGIE